jgi:hypothetical protein
MAPEGNFLLGTDVPIAESPVRSDSGPPAAAVRVARLFLRPGSAGSSTAGSVASAVVVAATSSEVAAAAGFATRAGARFARPVDDEARSAETVVSATSGAEGAEGSEGAEWSEAAAGAEGSEAAAVGAVSAETGEPSTVEAGAGAGSAADGQGCSVAPGGQAGFSGLHSGHSHGRNGLKIGVSAVYGQPLRRKLIGTNGSKFRSLALANRVSEETISSKVIGSGRLVDGSALR